MEPTERLQQAITAFNAHDWTAAVALLRECTADDPQNAALVQRLALACGSSGDWPGAEEALRQAIALRPRDAHNHFLLAQALERLGREDEAVEELKASLAINPQHISAKQTLERLRPSTPRPAAEPAEAKAPTGPATPWERGGPAPPPRPGPPVPREAAEPIAYQCRLTAVEPKSAVVLATGPVFCVALLGSPMVFLIGTAAAHVGIGLLAAFETTVLLPLLVALGAWLSALLLNGIAKVCGGVPMVVRGDDYCLSVRSIAPFSFALHYAVLYAANLLLGGLALGGLLLLIGIAAKASVSELSQVLGAYSVGVWWVLLLTLPLTLLFCLLQAAIYDLLTNWFEGILFNCRNLPDGTEIMSFDVANTGILTALLQIILTFPLQVVVLVLAIREGGAGVLGGWITSVFFSGLLTVFGYCLWFWIYNQLAGCFGGLKVVLDEG